MTSEIGMRKPTLPTAAEAAPTGETTLRERVEAVLRTVYDPEIPDRKSVV